MRFIIESPRRGSPVIFTNPSTWDKDKLSLECRYNLIIIRMEAGYITSFEADGVQYLPERN